MKSEIDTLRLQTFYLTAINCLLSGVIITLLIIILSMQQ